MTLHAIPRTTAPPAATEPRPDASRRRRVIEAAAFVTVWVTAGYMLRLSSNAYLLLGVPLTAAFQLLVRRRPLRELFAAGHGRRCRRSVLPACEPARRHSARRPCRLPGRRRMAVSRRRVRAWGLWHLPVASGFPLPLLVAELVVVHVALGVGLSFSWRRTRNLGGPALAHAVIDAVRNATMLGL